MRGTTVVIGFLIATGLAFSAERTIAQAPGLQAANHIVVVLSVEGMT